MGWQTKTDTQLGSVSLLHIVYKAHAKFTTGSDAHVSQTAMPQVSTLRLKTCAKHLEMADRRPKGDKSSRDHDKSVALQPGHQDKTFCKQHIHSL